MSRWACKNCLSFHCCDDEAELNRTAEEHEKEFGHEIDRPLYRVVTVCNEKTGYGRKDGTPFRTRSEAEAFASRMLTMPGFSQSKAHAVLVAS